jgi:hypothetical protein
MPDPLVIDVLLEFLEAFVHQLLFVRGVYASQLFERRRLYGIAIRRARHPDLCSYVSDVVASLRVSSGACLTLSWHKRTPFPPKCTRNLPPASQVHLSVCHLLPCTSRLFHIPGAINPGNAGKSSYFNRISITTAPGTVCYRTISAFSHQFRTRCHRIRSDCNPP